MTQEMWWETIPSQIKWRVQIFWRWRSYLLSLGKHRQGCAHENEHQQKRANHHGPHFSILHNRSQAPCFGPSVSEGIFLSVHRNCLEPLDGSVAAFASVARPAPLSSSPPTEAHGPGQAFPFKTSFSPASVASTLVRIPEQPLALAHGFLYSGKRYGWLCRTLQGR